MTSREPLFITWKGVLYFFSFYVDALNGVDSYEITLYEYDGRNLVTKEINALGDSTVYVYDGNGVVGVVMKVNDGYDWFIHPTVNCHGASVVTYENSLTYPIISNNHFNPDPEQWYCDQYKTFDWFTGSYIEYVKEDDFLLNPSKYIDNAYEKSKNDGAGYRL